eukprot:1144258-Pelagomonas_calceolata.AAC.1
MMVSMLPLCRLQLLPRPCVFTASNFSQANVPLVYTRLMGLSTAGGRRRGRSGFVMVGDNDWQNSEVCCAIQSSLPLAILIKSAPQGLLQGAFVVILPAALWHSPGRGHNGGACAVLQDGALHRRGYAGHAFNGMDSL